MTGADDRAVGRDGADGRVSQNRGADSRGSAGQGSGGRPGRDTAPLPQHRRGFTQPGRTKADRARTLPVNRQIKALLGNPTPSPAEQARLCELTGTTSFRAAVTAAKRILAAPSDPDRADTETAAPPPAGPRRNPGRRAP